MKYGYGIVDKDGKVYWEEGCVCEDKEPLESTCEAINDYEDPRAPYRVAELRVEDSLGASMIADERERQIEKEGFTAEHDDGHTRGELQAAAVAYILGPLVGDNYWPWFEHNGTLTGFKAHGYARHDRLHDLTVAGALIAAEIDRLLRVADTGT